MFVWKNIWEFYFQSLIKINWKRYRLRLEWYFLKFLDAIFKLLRLLHNLYGTSNFKLINLPLISKRMALQNLFLSPKHLELYSTRTRPDFCINDKRFHVCMSKISVFNHETYTLNRTNGNKNVKNFGIILNLVKLFFTFVRLYRGESFWFI